MRTEMKPLEPEYTIEIVNSTGGRTTNNAVACAVEALSLVRASSQHLASFVFFVMFMRGSQHASVCAKALTPSGTTKMQQYRSSSSGPLQMQILRECPNHERAPSGSKRTSSSQRMVNSRE